MFVLDEQDLKYQFKTFSACTLHPSELGLNESGWLIEGDVIKDYYEWVNEFKASHPEYGVVYGDFETNITATSREAYDHFVKHHTPFVWDYHDI
jgi:hypothetical protein